MTATDYTACANAIAKKEDADVLFFCGGITHGGEQRFQDLLASRKQRRKNVYLFLTTQGGSPDAAYKIARCLQRAYTKFTLLVDWHCKSAGTLIAIGADEIVMSDQAELGPLDTQLQKVDELDELTSGLTALQAFRTLRSASLDTFVQVLSDLREASGQQISTRTACDVATQMAVGLFSQIYQRIDPMLLGEHSRAMMIAEAYGKRLAKRSKILKQDALTRLVAGYPSHSHVIDREEASEVFAKVRSPADAEQEMMLDLHSVVTGFLMQKSSSRKAAMIEFLDEEPTPWDANGATNVTILPSVPASGDPRPRVGDGTGPHSRPTGAHRDQGAPSNGAATAQPEGNGAGAIEIAN